jgi:hypothetical protein
MADKWLILESANGDIDIMEHTDGAQKYMENVKDAHVFKMTAEAPNEWEGMKLYLRDKLNRYARLKHIEHSGMNKAGARVGTHGKTIHRHLREELLDIEQINKGRQRIISVEELEKYQG